MDINVRDIFDIFKFSAKHGGRQADIFLFVNDWVLEIVQRFNARLVDYEMNKS